MKSSLTLACLTLAAPALAQTYMDFGGMYGTGSPNYPNPYTGALSCPSGYTAYPILGTTNVDYSLYFCGRSTTGGTTPLAEFGGMYGYFNGSGVVGRPHFNPITGASSCPPGYKSTKVLGTVNVDHSVFLCHRPACNCSKYRLGGMYGGRYDYTTSTHTWHPNPLTGTNSCPAGYTAGLVLGTSGLDYPVYFCYQPL